MALVAGVIASAAPTPITMVTSMNGQKPLPVPSVAKSAKPDAGDGQPRAADEAVAVASPTACPRPRRSAGSRCSSAAAPARPPACCSRARAAGTAATRRRSRTWRRTGGRATRSRWRSRGGGTAAGRAAARRCAARSTRTWPGTPTPPTSPISVTGSVHPRSGPSMMPSTRRPMPTADTIEPRMSSATRSSARVLGTTRIMPTHGDGGERGGEHEDRAPGELLEQRARRQDAEGAAGAGEAGPDADRLGPLLGREHAGDGRQRAGHEQRGADRP